MLSALFNSFNSHCHKLSLLDGKSLKLQTLATGMLASSLIATVNTPPLLAVPEVARSADSFIDSIGTNVHLNYYDTIYSSGYETVVKPRLQELGIRHVRDRINLNQSVQNSRFQDLATNYGIRATLSADPRSLTPSEAVATIQDIGTAVEAVEGPNEYDISGDGDWVAVVRSYMQQLHDGITGTSFTAGLPILGPSFVDSSASTQVGDLSAWVTYGNMHPYSSHGPQDVANQLVIGQPPQWNAPFGGKPMAASEFGYTTAPGEANSVSETVHGKYMPRGFLEHFRLGVVRSWNYELIDFFPDPSLSETEYHFGLLRNDNTAKPAFTAVKNLVGLLKDPGSDFVPGSLDYAISGDTGNVNRTLLQKRDGSFWLVLWTAVDSTDSDTYRSVTLTFNTPIGQASSYLPNKSAGAVSTWTNPTQIALTVPDYPLIIKLVPGASSSSTGKPDLIVTATNYKASSLAVGTPVQFTATIKNQGSIATPEGTVLGVGFFFNGQGSTYYYNDQYTASLAPGKSVTLSALQSWTPPTSSSITVQAWVDDVNRLAESNETNNTLSQTLVIGAGTGLKGEYFNDQYLNDLALTRIDQTVDFNWGSGSPSSAVLSDHFSARWSGQVQPQYSQTYTFYTDSDDGVRLRINGQLLIDNWSDHPPTQNSATIALVAGQKYDIELEYYENGGGTTARLSWSSPSQQKQVIPQSRLFPAP